MSLSSDNMLKLMAYADGELEGDELVEAQKLLASDPDSVRFVEQLGGLGEIVSEGHDARSGEAIAKFDVTDSVMSRISLAKESAPPVQASKVTSLAAAREKRNGLRIGAGIAAALALAASVFLVAQHRTDETPMAKGPSVPVVQPGPATAVAAVSPGSGAGVDVSTVNSPGNSVSVFYLPTANELSTSVVVWVDETGEK